MVRRVNIDGLVGGSGGDAWPSVHPVSVRSKVVLRRQGAGAPPTPTEKAGALQSSGPQMVNTI